MTQAEFMTARRMWAAVADGETAIAPPGDARTHAEWLTGLYDPARARQILTHRARGYVLDGTLVAYQGENMSRWAQHAQVKQAVLDLRAAGVPVERVGLGVRSFGEWPWVPYTRVVDADRYLEFPSKEKADG